VIMERSSLRAIGRRIRRPSQAMGYGEAIQRRRGGCVDRSHGADQVKWDIQARMSCGGRCSRGHSRFVIQLMAASFGERTALSTIAARPPAAATERVVVDKVGPVPPIMRAVNE
jgi:hypothetical protein